jgi:S-formylglutathione hydrolase FrmB
VEDTWAARDLEETDLPEVADIANRTGLVAADVALALKAMDGVYVDLQMTMGDSARWYVRSVSPEARRAVGQWPTAESLIGQLVAGLEAAAEREDDPERRGRLRQAASLLGGAARDIAVDIAAKVIERGTGLG